MTLRSMIGKTQVDLRNFEKRQNVWIVVKRNAEKKISVQQVISVL